VAKPVSKQRLHEALLQAVQQKTRTPLSRALG
jgi:hypothetical protein